MKKSKIYFIVPIIALAAFFAYYLQFSSEYEAKQAAVVAKDKAVKAEKIRVENELKEKAVDEAIEQQKVRKLERLEREAKEQKQKDDREYAKLGAEKADQEQQKLQRQAEKLTHDVAAVKAEIEKIQADTKRSVEEEDFLKEYVAKAMANQAHLTQVLQKIVDADAAAVRAAAIAAAEAAKK
jgi:ABC-type multidrug transport system fused ATPase/permease subunit